MQGKLKLEERVNLLLAAGEQWKANQPEWEAIKVKAIAANSWFTDENIESALHAIQHQYLSAQTLSEVVERYHLSDEATVSKKVGIILAGNIPFVGIHDIICTFISGHIAVVKTSSKDDVLIRHFIDKLCALNSGAIPYFQFPNNLVNAEAYIATGSNNSARYFKAYFGKYPNIIRKNRNAVAILNGEETKEQLLLLGNDIFSYFGLGCRNVSKLYVPNNYDFTPLLDLLHENYKSLVLHSGYKNNYDYCYAVYLLSKKTFLMTGSLLLIEDEALTSRIATVHYEYYTGISDLKQKIEALNDQIQCVVGSFAQDHLGSIPFGTSQSPSFFDYADGIDTMQFLYKLN